MPRGHGYVQFATKEEADEAVRKTNGTRMLGCDSIETKIAIPKHQRQSNPSNAMPTFNPFAPTSVPSAPTFVPRHATTRHEPGTSVYVRGLTDDVDDDKLREEFEQYGTIVDIKVIYLLYTFFILLVYLFLQLTALFYLSKKLLNH